MILFHGLNFKLTEYVVKNCVLNSLECICKYTKLHFHKGLAW